MVNGEMGVSWEGEPIDDFMDLSDTNFLEVCEAFEGKIMMKNEKEHKQVSFTEEELINAIDISSGNKEVGEEEAKERGNADSAEGASKTTIDLDPEEIDLKTVSSGDKSIEISGLLKEETYLLSGTKEGNGSELREVKIVEESDVDMTLSKISKEHSSPVYCVQPDKGTIYMHINLPSNMDLESLIYASPETIASWIGEPVRPVQCVIPTEMVQNLQTGGSVDTTLIGVTDNTTASEGYGLQYGINPEETDIEEEAFGNGK